jgi:hypothetical protein
MRRGTQMASEEHYRERATECMQAADTMFETDRKVSLLELAQRWLRLAHLAEAAAGDALLHESPSQRRH